MGRRGAGHQSGIVENRLETNTEDAFPMRMEALGDSTGKIVDRNGGPKVKVIHPLPKSGEVTIESDRSPVSPDEGFETPKGPLPPERLGVRRRGIVEGNERRAGIVHSTEGTVHSVAASASSRLGFFCWVASRKRTAMRTATPFVT